MFLFDFFFFLFYVNTLMQSLAQYLLCCWLLGGNNTPCKQLVTSALSVLVLNNVRLISIQRSQNQIKTHTLKN